MFTTPRKNHQKQKDRMAESSSLSFGLTDSAITPARFSINQTEESNIYTDSQNSPTYSPISKTSSSNSLTNSPTTPLEIPKALDYEFGVTYLPATPPKTPLCSPRNKTEVTSVSSLATYAYPTTQIAQAFEQAEKYFQANPSKIKFKNNTFGLPSFLKIDQKIFMVPKNRLGKGANAYAKLVIDQEGVKYVLKVIPANEGDEAHKRWLNEKNILKELNIEHIFIERDNQNGWLSKNTGHPDHAPSQFNKKLILLTKYEDNVNTVKEYFQQPKKYLTALDRLELLSKILKELQKIHNKGVIHNDVTLDNILFKLDDQGKIDKIIFIDFEFSRKLNPGQLVAPAKDYQGIACNFAPETYGFTKNHLNTNGNDKEHPLVVHIKEVEEVIKTRQGFISPFSDLYKLGKNLMGASLLQHFYRNFDLDNNPDEQFLAAIITEMTNQDPFQRSSTEKLIKKCEDKIEELKSRTSAAVHDDVVIGGDYLKTPSTPIRSMKSINREQRLANSTVRVSMGRLI